MDSGKVTASWLHSGADYYCSNCGFSSENIMYVNPSYEYTHYKHCPNCGASMVEVQEVRG